MCTCVLTNTHTHAHTHLCKHIHTGSKYILKRAVWLTVVEAAVWDQLA